MKKIERLKQEIEALYVKKAEARNKFRDIANALEEDIKNAVNEVTSTLIEEGWIRLECFADYAGSHPERYDDIHAIYWVHPKHADVINTVERTTSYLSRDTPSFIEAMEALPEEDVFEE